MSLARHARLLAATAPQPRDELGRFQHVNPFAELNRYWNDPEYRAQVDADADRRQAEVYATMDAGIARHRAKQEESEV